MILGSCAKCFLIYSIISFKNRAINSGVIFSLWETWQNLTAILITRSEHQRLPLSKENTIERKHKSARFSYFSRPPSKSLLQPKAITSSDHVATGVSSSHVESNARRFDRGPLTAKGAVGQSQLTPRCL